MKEIWKDIEGFNYIISNYGRVKNIKTNRILRPKVDNGYLRVELFSNGKGRMKLIHRLVAQAFIPNPNHLPCVNHKDENKGNNYVENLEWCDHQYNNCYGSRIERVSNKNKGKHPDGSMRWKPILQYSINGTFIKEWPSLKSINEEFGYSIGNISQCCNGKYKTANGFVWKFKKDVA